MKVDYDNETNNFNKSKQSQSTGRCCSPNTSSIKFILYTLWATSLLFTTSPHVVLNVNFTLNTLFLSVSASHFTHKTFIIIMIIIVVIIISEHTIHEHTQTQLRTFQCNVTLFYYDILNKLREEFWSSCWVMFQICSVSNLQMQYFRRTPIT